MALLSVRDRKIIFDHVIRQWCCGACVFLYVVFFLCVSSSGVRDHSRSRCRFYLVYVVFCVVHSHALAQRTESARERARAVSHLRDHFSDNIMTCAAR